MSFHWLTQISPSATYGLALLGVAWLFVLRGCLAKSPVQLVFGWCVAAVIVAYKLHYVVASALLFLVVPALFFGVRKSVAKRALLLVASVGLYATALAIGQQVPGVPLIRFDGSSTGEILTLVQSFLRPGPFKEFLSQHMGRGFSWTSNLLYGIPYVLFSVFGVSLLGFTILVALLRKRLAPLALVFPLLLIANFLLMFFGLALDFQSSTPDELNHRPLMIVYFFFMAWSGGALGVFLLKAPHLRSRVPAIAITLSAALMVVPAYQGRGVQLMWVMPKISPVRLPKPVMEVAEYIRSHGSPEDVFQDTQFDRVYAIAALSERRPFVAHTLTRMPFREEMVSTRTVAVNRIMAMKQAKLVSGTLQAYGVRWFVVPAGNRLNWPAELADSPVYRSGPLSLYEF
jgi:GNAT superfamily N-acetyltransferase